MPTTFVLDIETIGCPEAAEHPETIAAMAARREMDAGTFAATCPALARPVLVGLLNTASDGRCVAYDSRLVDVDQQSADLAGVRLLAAGGEAALLMIVHDLLAKANQLVTFNGRGFDLPLLLLRAMAHDIAPATIVQASMRQKPWDDRPHTDMMNVLSFGGATGRYPLAAYGIGLTGTDCKAGGDGAHVGKLVAARDGTSLARYCLGDVAQTYELAKVARVL